MSVRVGEPSRVPRWVSLLSALLRPLLAVGVPLGPNGLITIRGRTSGLPRTTPVAIIEVAGRRWVWAPWGDVHWVRNLLAAGRATTTTRRRTEEVRATELDPTERVWFFHDVLATFARSIPGGVTFVRIVEGVNLDDPIEAAEGRRVFELHPSRRQRPTVTESSLVTLRDTSREKHEQNLWANPSPSWQSHSLPQRSSSSSSSSRWVVRCGLDSRHGRASPSPSW
jgi:deazaflavin-dependent oxidoreductase (nitroreductase family)